MNFNIIISHLSQSLKLELPGNKSHAKMMATAVSGQRLRFKSDKSPKKGAVLILLYEEEGNNYFVLTQRQEYKGTHGGQVSFPGGKMEESDKDLIETALRETEEEIGVKRETVEVIGCLTEYFVGASNHMVLPVIGYLDKSPVFIRDHYEVKEIMNVSVEHLINPERLKTTELEVGEGKFRLNAPYFDLNEKIVWGATAGILSELKDILEELFNE